MFEIRKKSGKVWILVNQNGSERVVSNLYFKNEFENDGQERVEFIEIGGGVVQRSLITEVNLYDDTGDGAQETFTTGEQLGLRLEALDAPFFKPASGGSGAATTIIDNLTSTSTAAALSANQGRELKSQVDAIAGVDATGFESPGSENTLGINTGDDTPQKIFDKLNAFTGGSSDIPEWQASNAYLAQEEFTFTTTNTTAVDANGDEIQPNKIHIGYYSTAQTSGATLTNGEMLAITLVSPSLGGSVEWSVVNSAGVLSPGKYIMDMSGGSFTVTLDSTVNGEYEFADPNFTSEANPLTIGTGADSFTDETGAQVAGAYIVAKNSFHFKLVCTAANEYRVIQEPGESGSEPGFVQPITALAQATDNNRMYSLTVDDLPALAGELYFNDNVGVLTQIQQL